MAKNHLTISIEDQMAIKAAAKELYFVEEDNQGNISITLDVDVQDTNELLLQVAYDHRKDGQEKGSDEPVQALLAVLRDQIHNAWDEAIWIAEDEILRNAGFDPKNDLCEPQKEWLREHIFIDPPYDHYLSQDMCVNIMLKTPDELNSDFGMIHHQHLAMARPDELVDSSPEAIHDLIHSDSSLKRLVVQQGHTMEELSATMKDYMEDFYAPDGSIFAPGEHPAKYLDANGKSLPYEIRMDIFTAGRSRFITSLCEELDNQTYTMGCITVLAQVTMEDYCKMMSSGAQVTMPVDSMVGIFNPWNGCGSILGIELADQMTFSREDIYDVQIEGANPDFGYTVDGVYSLVRSAWKKPDSIEIATPEHKKNLGDLIHSAEAKKAAQNIPVAIPVQRNR